MANTRSLTKKRSALGLAAALRNRRDGLAGYGNGNSKIFHREGRQGTRKDTLGQPRAEKFFVNSLRTLMSEAHPEAVTKVPKVRG